MGFTSISKLNSLICDTEIFISVSHFFLRDMSSYQVIDTNITFSLSAGSYNGVLVDNNGCMLYGGLLDQKNSNNINGVFTTDKIIDVSVYCTLSWCRAYVINTNGTGAPITYYILENTGTSVRSCNCYFMYAGDKSLYYVQITQEYTQNFFIVSNCINRLRTINTSYYIIFMCDPNNGTTKAFSVFKVPANTILNANGDDSDFITLHSLVPNLYVIGDTETFTVTDGDSSKIITIPSGGLKNISYIKDLANNYVLYCVCTDVYERTDVIKLKNNGLYYRYETMYSSADATSYFSKANRGLTVFGVVPIMNYWRISNDNEIVTYPMYILANKYIDNSKGDVQKCLVISLQKTDSSDTNELFILLSNFNQNMVPDGTTNTFPIYESIYTHNDKTDSICSRIFNTTTYTLLGNIYRDSTDIHKNKHISLYVVDVTLVPNGEEILNSGTFVSVDNYHIIDILKYIPYIMLNSGYETINNDKFKSVNVNDLTLNDFINLANITDYNEYTWSTSDLNAYKGITIFY